MALGTPTVTATRDVSGRAAHLSVSAPGATGFTVYRTLWTGTEWFDPGREGRYNVRGFVNVPDTSKTGYDVDYPQGKDIRYRVVAWDADTTVSSGASLTISAMDYDADVLLGCGATAQRAEIVVASMTPQAFSARAEQVKVIGRRDPVAIGDRRQYPTFDLVFHTFTRQAYAAVEAILYLYPVVNFSPRYPHWADSETALHVSVTDVEVSSPNYLRSETAGVREERTWTIRCAQVAAPATPRVSSLGSGW